MEKFRIILIPACDDDLVYEWEANCKDVEAAKEQATAYLAMSGDKFKSATVLSQWKSPSSWRQAIGRICNNFNL